MANKGKYMLKLHFLDTYVPISLLLVIRGNLTFFSLSNVLHFAIFVMKVSKQIKYNCVNINLFFIHIR